MDDQLTAASLRAWRKEAGMTQPELAELLGMGRSTIARWESGDDEVPKWLALARDGWRARQITVPVVAIRPLTEEDVRRIVRQEIGE